MLVTTDPDTVSSLRSLFDRELENRPPIVLWIGSGVSAWSGYPLWDALADQMHRSFCKQGRQYSLSAGRSLLDAGDYPGVLQACKNSDPALYYSELAIRLQRRDPTPIYLRFCRAISRLRPLQIITTNIDDLLESTIRTVAIGRFDWQNAANLSARGSNFMFKIHGSVTDIRSAVLTTDEYAEAQAEHASQSCLTELISGKSVLFIGYGMKDAHLLNSFDSAFHRAGHLAYGPHYALLPADDTARREWLRPIRYIPKPHTDHRDPIAILEELTLQRGSVEPLLQCPYQSGPETPAGLRSAHLLFDLFPPGTWRTSDTVTMQDEQGNSRECTLGNGLINSELVHDRSRALHDVIIGLVCFDEILAPIQLIDRLHDLLSSDRFWALISSGALKFINWDLQSGIVFPRPQAIGGGDLVSLQVHNPDMTLKAVRQIILTRLKAVPGRESEAAALFDLAERSTRQVTATEEGDVAGITRSLLLRPSVRKMIGMSEGTPLSTLPRWMMFPVLRLANVVRSGIACRLQGISSARFDGGFSSLAEAAFSAAAGKYWAEDVASYTVAGNYSSDLGLLASKDDSILTSVLAFRETATAEQLRKSVLNSLAARNCADVRAAVDASLHSALDTRILEQSRKSFLLSSPRSGGHDMYTAVWRETRGSTDSLRKWKQRSLSTLNELCDRERISPYDACPCGSGEKLKFCCYEALDRSQ